MTLELHQFSPRSIPKEQMDELAALAQKFVETNPDELTTEYLLAGLLSDKIQVWTAVEGGRIVLALFVEVCHFKATEKSFIRILGLSGENYKRARPFFPVIEAAYAAQGIELSRIVGREGWAKELQPLGYEKHSVVYSKNLKGDGDE